MTARAASPKAEGRHRILPTPQGGPQASAFFALALDTGARRNELLGLCWSDVDLAAGTVMIARQLEPGSSHLPKWGPTKTEQSRTVTLNADTVSRLRAHRKQQRELMMANRSTYSDFGLVVAKEPGDLQTPKAMLGQPCLTLAAAQFRRVTKAAEVKRITFHGLRHTCITLSLGTGAPVHVVAKRVGHANATMTLTVYAHALPSMEREVAAQLGAVLAGSNNPANEPP